MFKGKGTYLLFLSIIFVWFLLIFLAPLFASLGGVFDLPSQIIYLIFRPFCHQIPERSFFLFGYPLGVCARCFGIYFGLLISALIYPKIKKVDNLKFPKIHWMLLALAPLAIDGITQLVGLRESTNLLRLTTGFIFGYVLLFYIVPAYNKTVKSIKARYFSK
ncbi:MAG: DUF2085 domain-containing protein [Candidatus Diapherotrites archaeon]